MPNGSPDFKHEELPVVEEFFSTINDVLTRFGHEFNLTIDRYWHRLPSWRFTFKHPNGGLGCIEVMKTGESEIKIYSYWWLDDFDKGTRYSRHMESETYRLQDLQLYNLLGTELKLLVTWRPGDWTNISRGFEEAWSSYKKEDFLSFNDSYSLPRLIK